jgi:hypothetical protein
MPTYPTITNYAPLIKHLAAVQFRSNRLWCLRSGVFLTEVNGEWMNEREFQERYPVNVPINFYLGKENADKTKDFLY